MKVVLRQDVEGVGTTGQVLEVSNGFARNHLIPQNLALPASKGILKQAEQMARARRERDLRSREAAETVGKALVSQGVTIAARSGSDDQLYGSVTVADISAAIGDLLGTTVDRSKLALETPIKALGEYEVSAELHPEVKVAFNIKVVAEA